MNGPLELKTVTVTLTAKAWVREDGRGGYDLEDISEIISYEDLELVTKGATT
jgi:hypothetical protein